MDHSDEGCTCEVQIKYQLLRIKGSTLWGFNIGAIYENEVKILGSFGQYKTKNEAELAASSFISGMDFAREILKP